MNTDDQNYQELQKLIKDVYKWVDEYLKPKSPERANEVRKNLMYLDITVRQDHTQAKAALYCAQAMWHMLFEDARRGARQRNIQGLPLAHELKTKDDLISKIDAQCKNHPDKNITWVRDRVAGSTGYSGARAVARKTGWYNPLK